MLVENNSNLIVAKMFLTYTIITFLQKFFPYIFLEVLDIAACDLMVPPLCKNESCI